MPEEPTAPENLDPQVQPPEPPPEEPAPEATNGCTPCPGPHTAQEPEESLGDPPKDRDATPAQDQQPEQ